MYISWPSVKDVVLPAPPLTLEDFFQGLTGMFEIGYQKGRWDGDNITYEGTTNHLGCENYHEELDGLDARWLEEVKTMEIEPRWVTPGQQGFDVDYAKRCALRILAGEVPPPIILVVAQDNHDDTHWVASDGNHRLVAHLALKRKISARVFELDHIVEIDY